MQSRKQSRTFVKDGVIKRGWYLNAVKAIPAGHYEGANDMTANWEPVNLGMTSQVQKHYKKANRVNKQDFKHITSMLVLPCFIPTIGVRIIFKQLEKVN
jgi:hypothetical protein